jgi:CubicO group peptidase (beta-lactamase class C family)
LSPFTIQVDAFVERVRQHWDVPGVAIAIVRRDGPLRVSAYGTRSVAASVPADIDTAFAIGSCSKAFTSALAAALVDSDLLGWDDPIRKYLPTFQLHDPWISDHVTLRDILASRTGLSQASLGEYGSDLGRAELLHRARYIQPACGFSRSVYLLQRRLCRGS